MDEFYKDKIDYSIMSQIKKIFIKDGVVVRKGIEGKKVRDGNIVFGTMAGPCFSHIHTLHEISHFVEIEDDRIFDTEGWGFGFGKTKHLNGYTWTEYKTDKPVTRELNVWAIQYVIQKHLGMDDSLKETISSIIYLPVDCLCHFSERMGTNSISDDKIIKSAIEYITPLIKKLSFNMIVDIYNKKLELFNNSKNYIYNG